MITVKRQNGTRYDRVTITFEGAEGSVVFDVSLSKATDLARALIKVATNDSSEKPEFI